MIEPLTWLVEPNENKLRNALLDMAKGIEVRLLQWPVPLPPKPHRLNRIGCDLVRKKKEKPSDEQVMVASQLLDTDPQRAAVPIAAVFLEIEEVKKRTMPKKEPDLAFLPLSLLELRAIARLQHQMEMLH